MASPGRRHSSGRNLRLRQKNGGLQNYEVFTDTAHPL
jgi:hypothetical protein